MKSLFITPPLTQINTPYPATAYIKGFLNTTPYSDCSQLDLGLELILGIFNKDFLVKLFDEAELLSSKSDKTIQILKQRKQYENTINSVIQFLQGNNLTLAHKIVNGIYLPQASRFEALTEETEWLFGSMGTNDKAKYLCTLYLEDIGDFIIEAISPYFGFSRYAEDIARSATEFAPIKASLEAPENSIDKLLLYILHQHIETQKPDIVGFTVPFPGNVYAALKCGGYIKKHFPNIKVMMGGGYVNTELREISSTDVFDYVDFITLDDGEKPILNLFEYLDNKRDKQLLKRTFILENNKVEYINNCTEPDIAHSATGTPDYSGLLLDKYISVIEMANPMHRLWSDGRWNKITVAHGCYWKKCSFCDISLDYIGRYNPASASELVDRIEQIVNQTQSSGFHFVDEAAPPTALRDLALEILKRKLDISWWTNIRFEKTFTADLCKLLAASGCIGVTGGLEVASDRLLAMMEKGVSVEQVANVVANFTDAGIMTHAYLMYGFPTQTAQETIDSLEVVRQLFENNILQSGFWHRFSMTAHSPVGLNPEKYKVKLVGPSKGDFAYNDLIHKDPSGCNHDLFAEGLRKSLYNFMHGNCLDWPTKNWFDFKTPPTTHPKNMIQKFITSNNESDLDKMNHKLIFTGIFPFVDYSNKNPKILIEGKSYKIDPITVEWIEKQLPQLNPENELISLEQFLLNYKTDTGFAKELILYADWWNALRRNNLLLIRVGK